MNTRTARIGLAFLALFLAACSGSHGDRKEPETLIEAPPGSGFVLQDASGRRTLATTIRVLVTDGGLLTSQTGATVLGPITIPAEARVLRLDANGIVYVKITDTSSYTQIGQLIVGRWRSGFALSTGESASIQTGNPGSSDFNALTPAMYVITRQGPKIRLVLVEYGG